MASFRLEAVETTVIVETVETVEIAEIVEIVSIVSLGPIPESFPDYDWV